MDSETLYTCELCGQDNLTEPEMKSHVYIVHIDQETSCPFCDLGGVTVDEINHHVNEAHLGYLSPTKMKSISSQTGQNQDKLSSRLHASSADTQQTHLAVAVLRQRENDDKPSFSRCRSVAAARCVCRVSDLHDTDQQIRPLNTSQSSMSELELKGMYKTFKPSERDALHDALKRTGSDKIINSNHKNSQSPKRTKLSLDTVPMDVQTAHNSSADVPQLHCPLCPWTTTNQNEINHHVNTSHLDVLSPAKSGSDSVPNSMQIVSVPSTSSQFVCPICAINKSNARDLELHVNSAHLDIISPDSEVNKLKSASAGGASSLTSASACGSSLLCPVCSACYDDAGLLAQHVDGHFSAGGPTGEVNVDSTIAEQLQREEQKARQLEEDQQFKQLQEKYGMDEKNNYKKQAMKEMERKVYKGQMSIADFYTKKVDMFYSDSTGVDQGSTCTKGLIARFKVFYRSTKGISSYHLASSTDHYGPSDGDRGWGCGYRNLQMLFSCLADKEEYLKVLFNGTKVMPSICKIQQLIEAAWEKGFDKEGAIQLNNKLQNTTKWIGATEIVATLSSFRVKCQLLDFHAPSGKNNTHPVLFEWVKKYFTSTDATFKPPLYLQHQGHSRTIVGIEQQKNGTQKLLIFDPSCTRYQMQKYLNKDVTSDMMRSVRRSVDQLKSKQYQIVAVVGVSSDAEYQESKILKSTRIP